MKTETITIVHATQVFDFKEYKQFKNIVHERCGYSVSDNTNLFYTSDVLFGLENNLRDELEIEDDEDESSILELLGKSNNSEYIPVVKKILELESENIQIII